MSRIFLGRIVFVAVSSVIVAIAGGGAAFIQRPVGAVYLTLWVIWWIATMLGRKSGIPLAYDRSQRAVVIALSIVIVPVLIIAPSWEYVHLSGPIPRDGLLSWVGLLLFAWGILLMSLAMRALGNAFTVRLGVQPGQSLVTSGPYRLVRHPGYLSYIFSLTGIGLSLSSLIALGLAILAIPFLLWRIQHEEQMLVVEFGEEYKTYKKQTKWRLIPLVY